MFIKLKSLSLGEDFFMKSSFFMRLTRNYNSCLIEKKSDIVNKRVLNVLIFNQLSFSLHLEQKKWYHKVLKEVRVGERV